MIHTKKQKQKINLVLKPGVLSERVFFFSQENLVISGEIWVAYNWVESVSLTLRVEVRDTCKHPSTHRKAHTRIPTKCQSYQG